MQAAIFLCAGCHGSDANGGELGPAITTRVPTRTDQNVTTTIRDGITAAGMPAFGTLTAPEVADLVRYLRTLKPRNGSGPARTTLTLDDSKALAGLVLNQSLAHMQLLGDDRKIHLLRKNGTRYPPVTSQADWTSYNGETSGSRYSALKQIDRNNVTRMAPRR